MSKKVDREKKQAPPPSVIFEGLKGHPPKNVDELNEWIASDEGKGATMFEPSFVLRWGGIGRS